MRITLNISTEMEQTLDLINKTGTVKERDDIIREAITNIIQKEIHNIKRGNSFKDLNALEKKNYQAFQRKHKRAKKVYYKCYQTGIAVKVVAVAEYLTKKSTKDISDYKSW